METSTNTMTLEQPNIFMGIVSLILFIIMVIAWYVTKKAESEIKTSWGDPQAKNSVLKNVNLAKILMFISWLAPIILGIIIAVLATQRKMGKKSGKKIVFENNDRNYSYAYRPEMKRRY